MTSPLESLRQALPDYARDIKLNLGTLLSVEGVPELTRSQKWGVAVAAGIASRNAALTHALEHDALLLTDEKLVDAARMAASIMAMTNVYYRAVHMADDGGLSQLPAGLRMNGLTRHGVGQLDFELFGLAASVVKGCGGCTKAHVDGARRHGASTQAIQAAIRIAAVVHATATVLDAMVDPALSLPLPILADSSEAIPVGDGVD